MNERTVAAVMGPVLHFRGEVAGERFYSITLSAPSRVTVDGRDVELHPIGGLGGATFFAADFSVPVDAGEVRYSVDGTCHRFRVSGGATRIAYGSCNGGEDEEHARAFPTGRNAMWRDLLDHHARDPFDLLIMGGDQIYADAVWKEPSFAAWRKLGPARWSTPFSPDMHAEAEVFFLNRYGEVWREPEVARAFATIPTIMMWDDHDISDGWGSYPDEERKSPVAQGLFAVARRAFAMFQLGIDPDEEDVHFGWTADCGPAHLIVPDLRSERRLDRVMDAGHALLADGLASGGHKLLVSSVPLVNVDLSRIERWLRMIGWHKYTDDLRDQWMSYAHRAEWERVVGRLLEADGPITVISGEIHLAAQGEARRGGRIVKQYTASGIAHPPPPKAFGTALGRLTRRAWRRGDVELRMRELGRTGRRYVAERNWLELTVGQDGLEAVLHAEETGRIDLTDVSSVENRGLADLPREAWPQQ